MIRVLLLGAVSLFVLLGASGCDSGKTKPPDSMMPVPKEGPKPAGMPGGDAKKPGSSQ